MVEQILSESGNYVISNVFAIFLMIAAVKWPRLARLLISVLFVGGGIWNLYASLTIPSFYVDTYGPLATAPYRAFIYGPFASNPALFVIPIALGELAIGLLADGSGTWVRLSMVAMTGFMLGLAPLGVGGAFPFSIFAIVAAFFLFRSPPQSSLFQDVAAVLAAVTHGFPPSPHPRPCWPRRRTVFRHRRIRGRTPNRGTSSGAREHREVQTVHQHRPGAIESQRCGHLSGVGTPVQ